MTYPEGWTLVTLTGSGLQPGVLTVHVPSITIGEDTVDAHTVSADVVADGELSVTFANPVLDGTGTVRVTWQDADAPRPVYYLLALASATESAVWGDLVERSVAPVGPQPIALEVDDLAGVAAAAVVAANTATAAATAATLAAERQACIAGTPLDPWMDYAAYTADHGGAVAAYTTDPAYPNAIKITVPQGTYTQVMADLTCDMTQGFLSFAHKPLDANFSSIGVDLSVTNADYTSRFQRTSRSGTTAITSGWQRLSLAPVGMSVTGATAADLADVRSMRFVLNAGAGGAAEWLIADLRWHPYPTGSERTAVVMFDDGFASVYTQAFPIMSALGLVGSVAISPSYVGQSGYATLAQLQEMQAAGWEMVAHGPTGLAGSSRSTIRTALRTAVDYMVDNNFDTGRGFYAYPGGSVDANVLSEVRRVFSAARLAGGYNYNAPLVDSVHLLQSWYFQKTTAVATATAAIDSLAARTGSILFAFHNIVPTTSATEDYSIADFTSVMTHLAASGVAVVVPSDIYDMTGRA